MKKMKLLKKIGLLTLIVGLSTSCSDDDNSAPPSIKSENLTIVENAVNTPQLSTLVAALKAANGDLVDLLGTEGPFTVLAPTNEAFQALLDTNPSWDSINDIDKATLEQVLLNHVISANIKSTDLETSAYVNTNANGANNTKLSLYYNTTNGVIFNGKSEVITADVAASNGTIHIVDNVITLPTVVDFALADPNFSTLVSALTDLTPNTDFASILSRTSGMNNDDINPNFTVFAPVNAAFNALDTIPEEAALTQILLHHVVSGANVTSSNLTPNGTTNAPTLQGDTLIITLPGTNGNIANIEDGSGNTDIGIVAVDVQATNGVIHAINKVAIPEL